MSKTIEIKCKGADSLPIDAILEFQGKLKGIKKKDLDNLKTRIIEDGFHSPIQVWDCLGDYNVISGHQRLKALLSLREDGYDLPLIPVSFVFATTEAEAKKIVLANIAQYGKLDIDELEVWLNDLDDGIAESLRFLDKEIKFDKELTDDLAFEEDDNLVWEAADLMFHTFLILVNRDIEWNEIVKEFRKRRK